ncbi:DNA polymerase III subunit delta' C-terminal domain-containing protein, partial [Photobacterium damselae]
QVAAVLPIHVVIDQIQKLNELHRQLDRHSGLNIELLVVEWLTGFILN